jgi:osmotically inducible lipoprotein OsmB
LLRRCDRQPQPGRNRNSSIDDEDGTMKTIRHFRNLTVAAISLMALSACAGMSQQDKSTAVGAGVGAVGGAVLTGGSAIGTVGGAAVGGIIGHEIAKDKK